MLSRSFVCAVIAFSFAFISVHADSLTTRDGGSLRGRLVTLDGRGAFVMARFEEGETQVLVPRELLAGIEFNALSSNPGPARQGLPMAVPVNRTKAPTDQKDDVVVLSSGEQRSCAFVEIDAQRLRCGSETIPLGGVVRVTLGRMR